jgi:hypothetical protein
VEPSPRRLAASTTAVDRTRERSESGLACTALALGMMALPDGLLFILQNKC